MQAELDVRRAGVSKIGGNMTWTFRGVVRSACGGVQRLEGPGK